MTDPRQTRTTWIIILTVMVFGLSYGLTAPLIALQLTAEGFSELYIGVNAAMHALGVFATAPFLPWLCRRLSPKRLIAVALGGLLVLLMLFPLLPHASWFLLRLGLGVFSEIILVATETWVNHTTAEQARARTMALYVASLSLGFALGPFILSWAGSADGGSFFIAAAITLTAAAILASVKSNGAPIAFDDARSLTRYLSMATLALAATALNAALESAGMNFLVIYAMDLGWPLQQATWLLSTLLLGAIVLQLPIAWLADRLDRRRLLIALSALSSLGALAWPLVLHERWSAYLLLFVWGGVFVGLYTVMVTAVGEKFRGTDLVGVYAALSVAWGGGALIGPVLAGIAMGLGQHGLPLLAALLCSLFTLFALSYKKGSC